MEKEREREREEAVMGGSGEGTWSRIGGLGVHRGKGGFPLEGFRH